MGPWMHQLAKRVTSLPPISQEFESIWSKIGGTGVNSGKLSEIPGNSVGDSYAIYLQFLGISGRFWGVPGIAGIEVAWGDLGSQSFPTWASAPQKVHRRTVQEFAYTGYTCNSWRCLKVLVRASDQEPKITAGFLYRAGAETTLNSEKNSEFLPERFWKI